MHFRQNLSPLHKNLFIILLYLAFKEGLLKEFYLKVSLFLNYLIPAVIAQIYNPVEELVISIRM